MRRALPTPDPPAEISTVDGLAYSLWLPDSEPWCGVVVLPGAGSVKESHHDFARAVREAGGAAICMDARGHGDSEGAMDARALEDIATVAGVLPPAAPRVLRGSSMGGALAILAAAQGGNRPALPPIAGSAGRTDAYAAVVAICPATADGLARGLRAGRFEFRADVDALEAFLLEHDVALAAEQLMVPLLLLHAEGDDVVPVAHSRLLAERAPDAKLIAVPGGHHRSIQHDAELQGETLRWLRRQLGVSGRPAA